MANKIHRSDPLTQAARNESGEAQESEHAKAKATALVREASEALAGGLPEDSAYAALERDALLNEAAKQDIRLGVFMSAEELRLVLEHAKMLAKQAPVAGTPKGGVEREAPEPVPPPPVDRFKGVGIPESPLNTWRANNENPKQISLKGVMTMIRKNKRIELRHYGADGVQAIANAGIPLIPVTEADL